MEPFRKQLYFEALDTIYWTKYEGKRIPTGDETRQALYDEGHSRGSHAEFKKYRDLWQAEQGIIDPKDRKLSEPLADPIQLATQAVREKLMAVADEKIKANQSEYEAKLNQVNEENARLSEALTSLTQEHESLKTKHETQTSELEDSKKSCEIAGELREQAKRDLALAQRERDAIQTESENWREVSQQSLKEVREINTQQCEQFAAALKELTDTYQSRLSETRERMEEQRQQDAVKLVNVNTEIQKLTQQLNKLRSEKQALETEKAVLTAREQQLNELVAVKTETIESLKAQNNTLSNELLQQQSIFRILKPLEKNMEAMLIHQADSKKLYSHLLQTLKERIARSEEVQT
jgi:chromosome segregation ATPase